MNRTNATVPTPIPDDPQRDRNLIIGILVGIGLPLLLVVSFWFVRWVYYDSYVPPMDEDQEAAVAPSVEKNEDRGKDTELKAVAPTK